MTYWDYFKNVLIWNYQNKKEGSYAKICVYKKLPGGGQFYKYLSNKITFFHSVKKIE